MALILVVEDNATVARMLARLLENAGHHPLLAHDGPAAIAAIGREPSPDLVLLDMMMPEMDGLEVLHRLRRGEGGPHLPPIVVFSALDDPRVVAAAKAAGARDYWVKASFRFDELPRRLEEHLNA